MQSHPDLMDKWKADYEKLVDKIFEISVQRGARIGKSNPDITMADSIRTARRNQIARDYGKWLDRARALFDEKMKAFPRVLKITKHLRQSVNDLDWNIIREITTEVHEGSGFAVYPGLLSNELTNVMLEIMQDQLRVARQYPECFAQQIHGGQLDASFFLNDFFGMWPEPIESIKGLEQLPLASMYAVQQVLMEIVAPIVATIHNVDLEELGKLENIANLLMSQYQRSTMAHRHAIVHEDTHVLLRS